MCKIDGKYKNECAEKLLSQIKHEDSITARHHLIAKYLHQRESQIEKIIANIDDAELDLELVIEQLWEDLQLAEEQINYLKSIKDRVQSQPKQEWSKEDEHCIELLLPIIDSSSLIPKNRKKCKEFLKSIKPNHWKPSEEQMKMLRAIVYEPYEVEAEFRNVSCRKILETLYKDLKNL